MWTEKQTLDGTPHGKPCHRGNDKAKLKCKRTAIETSKIMELMHAAFKYFILIHNKRCSDCNDPMRRLR